MVRNHGKHIGLIIKRPGLGRSALAPQTEKSLWCRLVVWKKGIDGEALWRTLCPTVSTGENDMFSLPFDLEDMGPDALRSLKSREQRAQQLVLNCSTRFTQLFNGFAGVVTIMYLQSCYCGCIPWLHENAVD